MAEEETDRLWLAFRAAPDSPVFHELVKALLASGRHGDAVRVCETAMKFHGMDARAYLAFGLALQGVGRIAEAQTALVRAVKLDTNDPASLRALGEVLLARGESRRAREMFAHALRLAPGDITLRELLERASAASGILSVPAAPAPAPPPPRHRPSSAPQTRRAAEPSDDTFEILESVEIVPDADIEIMGSEPRPMPAALEVALRAELTLTNLTRPGASGSSVPGTPSPSVRSFAAPPRASSPLSPALQLPDLDFDSVVEPAPLPTATVDATGEISVQDALPEPELQVSYPTGDVRHLAAGAVLPTPKRGRGAIFAVVAVVVLGAGVTLGGLAWMRAQKAERARALSAEATRSIDRGDAQGMRKGVRLLERAVRIAPADEALHDRLALARSLAFLEAGVGNARSVKRGLLEAGNTDDARAARAALRIATADWGAADDELRKGPSNDAGTAAYLRGLLAARRGDGDARERLEAVAAKLPRHVPTRLALAEVDLVSGAPEQANAEAIQAQQIQPASLRPILVSILAQAYTGEPPAILALADRLATRAAAGSSCERLLLATARSVALARADRVPEGRAAAESPGPSGCGDPLVLFVWARAASGAGARAEALAVVKEILRLSPAAVMARTLAATILVEGGQGAEAERLLADVAGSSVEVDLLLARAALAANDDPRAIHILETIERRAPDSHEARMLLLRARVRAGEPEVAAEVRALEATHPDDMQVVLAAGEVALAAHDAAGAIQRLERVVASAPGADVHLRLGQAYRLAGRFGEAIDELRAAFTLAPDMAQALEGAATLELARGRMDEAHEIALRLEATTAGRLAAAPLLAEIELGSGHPDAALARLDAMPAPDTTEATRHMALLRARALGAAGEIDRALRLLRPFVLEGRDAEALALRGEIRRARPTERVGAAEDFDEALISDPSLPEALLGRMEIALDRDEGGVVPGLVERTATALRARLRPPAMEARLLVVRARDLLSDGRRRDRPDAEALLVRATEIAPQHVDGWYWLGKLLGAREERGRAALQRVLELQPAGALADDARRWLR